MLSVKRYLAGGLIALLLGTVMVPVFANELAEQREQVQQQMQRQQEKTARAQEKVDGVTAQLGKVQRELEVAQNDYKHIQTQLKTTEHQIEENTAVLALAEKRLTERSTVLNRRLRDIYENGQLNYLDVLLGAKDFSDFTTRMDILQRILKKDLDLITKIRAERMLVLQTKEALLRDRAAILEMKQAAEAKKVLIEQRKNEQETLLASAVNERDVSEAAYNELLQTSRNIEQMIRRNQLPAGGPSGSTGSMMWPTAVREITSPYGWRTHPIFGTSRYHSGIDIGADYGDEVDAADGGVVIYSDVYGGYGKAVIIDHGGGITTLYAHNSQLLVSEGQQVRKGEAISRVGSTGYSTGPHLHFEVRKDGSPTNPLEYVQ